MAHAQTTAGQKRIALGLDAHSLRGMRWQARQLWVAPGLTAPGKVCERPVDFTHLYPTLCDLAGLPRPAHVEGLSIRPLLADSKAAWTTPAVTTYKFGNRAVRSERWRYIRYEDGGDELYDHDAVRCARYGNGVRAMEDPMHQLDVLGRHVLCTSVRDYMVWETAEGATFQADTHGSTGHARSHGLLRCVRGWQKIGIAPSQFTQRGGHREPRRADRRE